MITRLDIFTTEVGASARDSILFTNPVLAGKVRDELLRDDSLQGITRVEVVTVQTDEQGVDAFYERVIEDM